MPERKALVPKSDDWSDTELEAAVKTYLEMQAQEVAGLRVVKVDYYRKLSEKHGRSTKAWEYRMQNISSVLASLGKPWIEGLKPQAHVGAKIESKIRNCLLRS